MARFSSPWLLGVCALLLAFAPHLQADTPPETGFKSSLALQGAMEQARYFLFQANDPKKAVETLEEQLPRVNGNSTYLRLLRDAYRAYIKDLYLANQAALAQRYLDRLCVLDPAAANDPTLRPQDMAQHKILPPPAPKDAGKPLTILPNFAKNFPFLNRDKGDAVPAKPATVRAKNEEVLDEDPFDGKFKRPPESVGDKKQQASQLLAKAEEEFQRRRYIEARPLFEKAYHLDPSSTLECRERWGYCVLSDIAEKVNDANVPAKALSELQQQVQGALAMGPNLNKAGQMLLGQIEQRQKVATPARAAALGNLQHLGPNKDGWQVTETVNFFIFHKQNEEFAERVAQVAERSRAEMQRKWFGADGAAWTPKCELIVHPTGQGYSQMTGVSSSSPGHSRIENDPTSAARIVGRRMDMRLDSPGMLEAILPHETTHVVLAGQFGAHLVPRWADEGVAVLTEPEEKLLQHRRNLLRCSKEGQLFSLKELMQMENYPEPRRVSAFYAQSVVLVEFLTSQKGPVTFTNFVREGLREGYESALRRHYGWDFNQLEARWQQQVLGEMNRVAAKPVSR